MAITLVQTKTTSKTVSTGTTSTVALSTTTTGNTVVVGGFDDSGSLGGITGISCTGMSFAKIDESQTGDTFFNGSLWYAYNITGATTPTLTVTYAAGLIGGAIVREYSGLTTTDPLDKHTIAHETSANAAPNSGATATLVGSNDLVIGFAGTGDSGNTYTAGAGYGNATTLKVATTVDMGMEDKILSSSTAAQTATFSITNTSVWACAVATFKAASAGTLYTSSQTAGLSFVGSVSKKTLKPSTASLSFGGSMSRFINRKVTAGLSFVGLVNKVSSRKLAGALSFSGNFTASHLFMVTLAAAVSFSGAIKRQTNKQLTASLSTIGSVAKYVTRSLSASASFTGSMTKKSLRSVSGLLSFISTRINLVTNPSFETGLTGWLQYGGNPVASLTQSTDFAFVGTFSAKIVNAIAASGGGYNGGAQYNSAGMVVGAVHTVSVYAKGAAGSENLNIYIGQSDNPQTSFTLTASWARYSFTFTALQSNPSIYIRSGTASATWYIDAVQLEAGAASPYFDGATNSGVWSGTPHASTSYLNQLSKVTSRNLPASLSFVGTIARYIVHTLTAALSFVGTTKKFSQRSLTASVSFTGAIKKLTTRSVTAGLSFIGGFLTGSLYKRVFTATVGFTGSISKQTTKSMAASISFTGAISKTTLKSLTASLSFVGSLSRLFISAIVTIYRLLQLLFVRQPVISLTFVQSAPVVLTFVRPGIATISSSQKPVIPLTLIQPMTTLVFVKPANPVLSVTVKSSSLTL